MNILLTGAEGFTGRHFVQRATQAGHRVHALRADLSDKLAVSRQVQQARPSAVVHLAAISFVGHTDETAFYGVNVVGTMNLLAALVTLPERPQKVLLASSANIYGNCSSSPISEEQPAAPVNHYATSKLAMEHMAGTYADRLPIVISRPFNYTGAGQAGQFLIPKLVDHFARKAAHIELGNLHVEREFNDVRMVCDAYLALLAKGEAGEAYNVCTGQPHTLEHVLALLARITGHRMAVQINPDFVRANEVHRLCGNPAKLQASVGALAPFELADTLRWMLQSASPD
jgi:nucleoside-diphosphate-sugar epimerase